MNFTFLNIDGQKVHEETVTPAFLHVILDFELASTRYNKGKPLPLYFDHLESFFELTDSKPEPTDFGGAKATLLADPKTGDISVCVYTPFGNGQEALIAHEVAHFHLLALGYPVTMPLAGISVLATGISNIGSHYALNQYLRSCGIDVDSDNERRVRNMMTYLAAIDFSTTNNTRLSLDFVDALTYVCNKTKNEFEALLRTQAPGVHRMLDRVRSVVDSVSRADRLYPMGSRQVMERLCKLFPDAREYVIRSDVFASLFHGRESPSEDNDR